MTVDKHVQNMCKTCVKWLSFTQLFHSWVGSYLSTWWINHTYPLVIKQLCQKLQHRQKTNTNLFILLMHTIHKHYHYYYHII